jgi:hypothetical protein
MFSSCYSTDRSNSHSTESNNTTYFENPIFSYSNEPSTLSPSHDSNRSVHFDDNVIAISPDTSHSYHSFVDYFYLPADETGERSFRCSEYIPLIVSILCICTGGAIYYLLFG